MDANNGCAVRSGAHAAGRRPLRAIPGHRDGRGRHLQPGERRLSPVKLTQGFATTTSPTMQSDGLQIAFVGRRTSADSNSIWLLPGAGGSVNCGARRAREFNQDFANPRSSRERHWWLLYNSDAGSRFNPKPWYRNVDNLGTPANRVMSQGEEGIESYMLPAWGPDIDGNGLPDSIVCAGYTFFGSPGSDKPGSLQTSYRPGANHRPAVAARTAAASEPDWSPNAQCVPSLHEAELPWRGPGHLDRQRRLERPEHRGPRDAAPRTTPVPRFCCGRHHDLLRLESGGLLRTERHL